MMPKDSPGRMPTRIPPHLAGDTDPDTLDGLVRSCRRLRSHWPLPMDPERAGERGPGSAEAADAAGPAGHSAQAPHGVSVPDRTAELVRGMADYGAGWGG